jgi:hypothetical protein
MANETRPTDIRRSNLPADVTRDIADDRAQPGDVLGIERDGEQTHIGETAEDEDERRRDAEQADRNRRS